MKKNEKYKLSFVILTWNSEKFTEKCLKSIKSSTNLNKYEVIIVDNGSKDNTINIIKEVTPLAQLIENNSNKGVAPARNQGLTVVGGEYIVILDIDTYIENGSIDRIVEYMDQHREVGICSPRLEFANGTIQESARRFPNVITKICRRLSSKWAIEQLEKETYKLAQIKEPIEVDYVIGACQVIRKEALDEVGLLDENIFYGPEDIDFCARMWLKGWKVIYFPDSQVVHYEQRITKGKLFSKITLEHIKGLLYFFFKYKYFLRSEKLYNMIKKNNL